MGTEMLELDVRLTADKQVVVCHDDELSRVTNTDLKICDLNFTVINIIFSIFNLHI